MPMYFGPEVDAKIVEYLAATDEKTKHAIYEEGILGPMTQLIENLLYMYGYYRIDDPDTLKYECLSDLYRAIPKFDPTRGKKGFSYFNAVAKNWFIGKYREKTKRLRQQSQSFYGIDHDVVRSDPSLILQSHEDEIVEREFLICLHREMEDWRKELEKKQEVQVLDSIVFLLQNPDLVSIYNKKAVFLYIREMTGLTAKQVNSHMGRLKQLYEGFKERFHDGEEE